MWDATKHDVDMVTSVAKQYHGQPRSETSIANQFYLILMVYINVDIYIYVLYIHTYMHACMHAYIHFITLHYITLHYITYIHMYIFTTHGEFLDP